MALIPAQIRTRKSILSVRLEQSLKDLLDQYCFFGHCGRQHVVTHALTRLFADDQSFQEWQQAQTRLASSPKGKRSSRSRLSV